MKTQKEKLLKLIQNSQILRARDILSNGIHQQTLYRAYRKGLIARAGRGLYTVSTYVPGTYHGLIQVAKIAPDAVVCLTSALSFHEIGTQLPAEIWIALEKGKVPPKINYPPIRVVHYSGMSYSEGVEKKYIDGVNIKVYSPVKTVADCFKFRNKIGLDVAVEALRVCVHSKKHTVDEFIHYARICRVERIVKPYLEALL
jgi:predicted transcriptional regulator of viral defense system